MCCIQRATATARTFKGERAYRKWRVNWENHLLEPTFQTGKPETWQTGIAQVKQCSWNYARSSKGLYGYLRSCRTEHGAHRATGTVRVFGDGFIEGNNLFAPTMVIESVRLQIPEGTSVAQQAKHVAAFKENYPGVRFSATAPKRRRAYY